MKHTSILKRISAGLIAVACIMGFTFTNVASALTLDTSQKVQLNIAIEAARCGILAQAMGEPKEVLQVYATLAKPFARYQPLIFEAGYISGVIDAQAYGQGISHEEAATRLYKRFGCAANVQI